MTAVEHILNLVVGTDEQGKDVRVKDTISKSEIAKAKEMEMEQREKLWTNEEVFDMLYKTDKFLMIDLREYWKTIEK